MSPAFIEEEVAIAQDAFLRQACTLAAIALLLYDTCQTADLELGYIWTRGRARMVILFVTIRHLQLVAFVLNSIGFALVSPEICTTFKLINSIVVVIPYISWAVFLGWRAYALSSGNAFVGLLVFICSASFASPSVLQTIWTTRLYVPTTPPTCVAPWKWAEGREVVAYFVYASRPANILAEVVVLVLTYRATYRAWLSSRNAMRPASLPDVLYTNGVLCFSVGTVLHIFTAILGGIPSSQDSAIDTASTLRDVIITILLSRFILELAKAGASVKSENLGAHATDGVLTTQRTDHVSDVPSQLTLDDEYNGREFDKDVETFELRERFEA